jgi:hypothetical protein
LLESQFATVVTPTDPLQVAAVAVSAWVAPVLKLTEPLVGAIVIDVTHPTVTVRFCVPLMVGFTLEVAVTVAVPRATDVTKPEVEMVATPEAGRMLQETDGLLFVLPSLLIPNAVIWTVLPVVPVRMVGVGGPTAIEDSVGLTKKPLQLTAKASVASAAKAPARRSLYFTDDIVV